MDTQDNQYGVPYMIFERWERAKNIKDNTYTWLLMGYSNYTEDGKMEYHEILSSRPGR
jgi:hypothetical protein